MGSRPSPSTLLLPQSAAQVQQAVLARDQSSAGNSACHICPAPIPSCILMWCSVQQRAGKPRHLSSVGNAACHMRPSPVTRFHFSTYVWLRAAQSKDSEPSEQWLLVQG